MKTCPKCGEDKQESDFGIRTRRSVDGPYRVCRSCAGSALRMKKCPHCEEEKLARAFTKDKSQPDGLAPSCRVCKNTYDRRRRLEEVQTWRQENLAARLSSPPVFVEALNSFISSSAQDRVDCTGPILRMNSAYYPPDTDLRYTDITHEEERRLFAAARAGDAAAKEFLIKNHLLFALNQGRAWSRGKLPEDEVASAANFALVQSFERFDYARENRFAAFLRPAIRGAIARLWRSKNATDMPNFPEKDGSPDKPTSDDFVDHPVEADDHAAFMMKTLDAAKGVLTEREAEVVRLLFGEEKLDMADIAEQKGLSRERIRQIKEAALMKLRREMTRRMEAAGESR